MDDIILPLFAVFGGVSIAWMAMAVAFAMGRNRLRAHRQRIHSPLLR